MDVSPGLFPDPTRAVAHAPIRRLRVQISPADSVLQAARFMLVDTEGEGTPVRLTREDGAFVVGWAALPPDSVRMLLERLR